MEYIQSPAELLRMASGLGESQILALDTEAAGYHRYMDRVCLVQLSTRTHTYVIDALAVRDLEPLAGPLADPAVETVLHDADYDLRLLHRDFGLVVRGLFDTKLAAQLLGEPAIGLASLVSKYLGVQLEKKHQRADWAKRPLPPELLEYAAEDTRHLPALRDALREALIAAGRLHWAEEEFRIAESVRWTPAGNGEDAYLRIKGTRDLTPRQLAALREVYAWREDAARSRDVAPFRVLSNEAMIEIVRRLPATSNELAAIPGVGRAVVGRSGVELLRAIERARSIPESELPTRPRGPRRPAPDPAFDARVERLRTARDRAADALGLDRGFFMPRAQLEEIARLCPGSLEELARVPEMRKWQIEAAGTLLLEALAE